MSRGSRAQAPPAGSKGPGARGFALVELCIVLLIIGILLRVALPNLSSLVTRARAAQIMGDLHAVRAASVAYYADVGRWPAESATGRIPARLAPYLPRGFSFRRGSYQLDWEYWVLANGLPRHPRTRTLIGVSAVIRDARLGNALQSLIGQAGPRLTLANRHTLIIVGTGEGL